ncbi:MAG: pilus assembly protein PilZ [Acidobacteria bacterium]|nr:MAG: pilus assembly protein PilZ [Acidobacteriota bacterium]
MIKQRAYDRLSNEPSLDENKKPGALSDSRRSRRLKTLKGAKIVWPDGVPVRCIVRDLSNTGAKLQVDGPILRNVVDLIFDHDQSCHPCRVVWRKDPLVGVSFL